MLINSFQIEYFNNVIIYIVKKNYKNLFIIFLLDSESHKDKMVQRTSHLLKSINVLWLNVKFIYYLQ